MTISEKVAYLSGLCEGLNVNEQTSEGKIIKEILNVLSDMALEMEIISEDVEILEEALEDTFEDIEDIFEEIEDIYETIDDSYDEIYDDMYDENIYDVDSDDECDCDECLDDTSELYEVVCPTCSEEIFFDAETLAQGSMKCHACGEDLEFDMSLLDD